MLFTLTIDAPITREQLGDILACIANDIDKNNSNKHQSIMMENVETGEDERIGTLRLID